MATRQREFNTTEGSQATHQREYTTPRAGACAAPGQASPSRHALDFRIVAPAPPRREPPPGSVFTDYPENARIPLPRLTRGARSAHCAERRRTTFHVRAGAPSGGVLAPVARTARLASAGSVPVVARIIACPLPVTRPSSPRPPPASQRNLHRPRWHPRMPSTARACHPPTRTRGILQLAPAACCRSRLRPPLTRIRGGVLRGRSWQMTQARDARADGAAGTDGHDTQATCTPDAADRTRLSRLIPSEGGHLGGVLGVCGRALALDAELRGVEGREADGDDGHARDHGRHVSINSSGVLWEAGRGRTPTLPPWARGGWGAAPGMRVGYAVFMVVLGREVAMVYTALMRMWDVDHDIMDCARMSSSHATHACFPGFDKAEAQALIAYKQQIQPSDQVLVNNLSAEAPTSTPSCPISCVASHPNDREGDFGGRCSSDHQASSGGSNGSKEPAKLGGWLRNRDANGVWRGTRRAGTIGAKVLAILQHVLGSFVCDLCI
ncbi:predicted protein [Postia placenta Mad-698-R]|nr:predicted protein [Postia placenta Mad-698-R]